MQQTIKRFYKAAAAAPAEGGFAVELDGRAVRTPAKAQLVVPAEALARAIAAEWHGQPDQVDPLTMPLNNLACTAIDIVRPQRAQVIEDLAGYGAHDLLCYWTDETGELLRRQQQRWQPLLDWAADTLGAPLQKTCSITSQTQAPKSLAALKRMLEEHDDFELTATAAAVKVSGSLVIGLALSAGRLDAEAAFAIALLDELYQAERWGEDAEAAARRATLRQELETAATFLELAREKGPEEP